MSRFLRLDSLKKAAKITEKVFGQYQTLETREFVYILRQLSDSAIAQVIDRSDSLS
jgi:hypothetical protein